MEFLGIFYMVYLMIFKGIKSNPLKIANHNILGGKMTYIKRSTIKQFRVFIVFILFSFFTNSAFALMDPHFALFQIQGKMGITQQYKAHIFLVF
ncbi:MAG: hypothetical protein HQK64_07390 [Desulfamplus sp.]|nr:hypothetical protein [Desulfamplus sp.]MBF0390391.1 hypothetical protein [Desulfamplus sp.]